MICIFDFKKLSTLSLTTRCTSDVNQIENTVNMFFEMIIPVPFITVIGMFLAFSKDGYMAFIIFIINPLIRLMNQIGYVIIAVLGAIFVIQGRLSIGIIQGFSFHLLNL